MLIPLTLSIPRHAALFAAWHRNRFQQQILNPQRRSAVAPDRSHGAASYIQLGHSGRGVGSSARPRLNASRRDLAARAGPPRPDRQARPRGRRAPPVQRCGPRQPRAAAPQHTAQGARGRVAVDRQVLVVAPRRAVTICAAPERAVLVDIRPGGGLSRLPRFLGCPSSPHPIGLRRPWDRLPVKVGR